MLHRRLPAVIFLAVALSLSLAAPATALPPQGVQQAVVVPTGSLSALAQSVSVASSPVAMARKKLKKADKKKWRRNYRPAGGVTFNTALGKGPAKNKINRKIITMIEASRSGTRIRIMSWNIMSRPVVKSLLKAQRRGALLRVLMAEENAEAIDNEVWRELLAGMAANNLSQKPSRQSWAKLCVASCRGDGGQAHSKFFLFSEVGKAKNVFVHGSANLTTAAAINQWNDIYTSVNRKKPYRFALRIFDEMAMDVPVASPYREWKSKRAHVIFHPLVGVGAKDPVLRLLKMVKCTGATNTASGRTELRIAPDVIRNARGLRIANRLRKLWEKGCSIRIGYTVMGVDVGRVLRDKSGRGPIPMRHLVQDYDGDGEFDKYFHLKAMSIVGNVKKSRGNAVVLNGSANWSGMGAVSDENVGIYWDTKLTKQYAEHIDYWFENFPKSAVPKADGIAGRVSGPIHTPDTLMVVGDQLVPGVDPYANMDLD